MVLLLGEQWGITISLLVLFFATIGGVFYSVWSISHRRAPPPPDLTPGGPPPYRAQEPEL